MGLVEIYAKFNIDRGSADVFASQAQAIVATTRKHCPDTLRCDWFFNEKQSEGIAMMVHRNDTALQQQFDAAAVNYELLLQSADVSLQVLGQSYSSGLQQLTKQPIGMLNFAYGMQARSSIQCVARPAGRQPAEHIEIYTHFALHPGKLEVFKRDAAALLEVAKQKDTGTSRYDWFYDDANLTAVAADTYDDPASMFSHMRNCHEAHNKLLHHSTMVTEFLGTLPLAAMQAVAKYDPYIAPFLVGLRAYSSGGYA